MTQTIDVPDGVFPALALAVLIKPSASAEKGNTHQIIVFAIPTIGSIPAVIIIIGFHAFLINEVLWQ